MSRLWRIQPNWVIRKLHRWLCVTLSFSFVFPFSCRSYFPSFLLGGNIFLFLYFASAKLCSAVYGWRVRFPNLAFNIVNIYWFSHYCCRKFRNELESKNSYLKRYQKRREEEEEDGGGGQYFQGFWSWPKKIGWQKVCRQILPVSASEGELRHPRYLTSQCLKWNRVLLLSHWSRTIYPSVHLIHQKERSKT